MATRVVLLARPGAACERLSAALQEAGAELVLVADPTSVSEDHVSAAAPQAILVALEPSVEDALDRFDHLLSDPGITVIFDEAELAAQRAGWDAARWVRHLSAKLHRHQDVLPPGAEAEDDWHPSPGPLEKPASRLSEFDLAHFADEAQERAESLPRDSGFEALHAVAEAPRVGEPADAGLTATAPTETAASEAAPTAAIELSLVDIATTDDASLAFENTAFAEETPLEAATQSDSPLSLVDTTVADDASSDVAFDSFDFSDDAASADIAPVDAAPRAREAEALEQRISGLSLADTDSYGHGPRRGVVLIEAGLGGPDAVRQLLSEIPSGFPRAVIVRLRMDGGRYDRLVKQMERAAQLPVALAEEGLAAQASHVYFMPPELTIMDEGGRLKFAPSNAAAAELYFTVRTEDSAVLFLSGSDPALVEAAMLATSDGALIAGQSPEGCYDSVASAELIARGTASGTPAELAELITARWPA